MRTMVIMLIGALQGYTHDSSAAGITVPVPTTTTSTSLSHTGGIPAAFESLVTLT